MGVEDLPVEILVMIFRELSGKEAVACRAVCRRWRDVVDSLSDEVWERYCCRDFRDPKSANKICKLGFRELYKSLALWTKVEQAEVTCKRVKVTSQKIVHSFKILDNNKLAVVISNNDCSFMYNMKKIQYYNLENMELICTVNYYMNFKFYDENEKLIVLLDIDSYLWVVTKSNKKKINLGRLYNEKICNFELFDTDVYYVNERSYLCVAVLKVVDCEETVESIELTKMHHSVIGFANTRKNLVYVLTDDGVLIGYNGADLQFYIHIGYGGSTIVTTLIEFGFDWTNPFIYKWLKTCFDSKEVGLPALRTSAVHSHNHVVLVGTPRRFVHIFKQPYKKNKSFRLFRARPNKSIDIVDIGSPCWPTSIKQIGVVEVLNGHRLVVLNLNKLFFVDLQHNTALKGSAHCGGLKAKTKKKSQTVPRKSVNGAPSKTKGKKTDAKNPERRKKKPTKVLTKRVYNTRSMTNNLHSTKKKV